MIMLKTILILILVISSHLAWATNPMILNLADRKFLDFHGYDEALDSCWNEAGDFLNLKCEKKIYECKVEERFTNGDLVKVQVNLQSSFVKKAYGFLYVGVNGQYGKSSLSMSVPTPWTTFEVPPGSEVIVYDFINSGFDIYERVKVPADGIVQLTSNTILPAHQEFYISMGKNWPKDASLSVSLLGQSIDDVIEGRQIYFKLAEGDYFLNIRGYVGEKTYKMYHPVSVTKEKKDAYRIQIDFNELSDTMEDRYPHHKLVLNNNKLSYEILNTDSKDVNFGFEEVSSVTLNKKLTIEKFRVRKSNIEILDINHFKELIKDVPIFSLEITGKCATYYSRTPLKSYPVFSKPNANKVGDIHIFSTNYEFQSFYEKLQSNSYQEFKSNLDVSNYVFYYQAVSNDDGFVNLGKGVWGNEGWIKVPFAHFFALLGMFYLEGKTDKEYVEYFRSYNNDLYKRIVSKNAFNRDSFFSGDIVKTDESELFNENEVLKIPIIDREGSNRNNMDVPKLVDLTNGEISIRGTVKSSRIALYKEPRGDSSIEGFLEFSYEDDLLKGYYLSVSNKKIRIPFTSDYYQGRCSGYFEYSALNNVEDVFNEYSQIGEGPWGKKAWVKSLRFDVGDKRLPVNFLYKDKHVLQRIEYYGESGFRIYYDKQAYDLEVIKKEDIRTSNKLVLKPYCSNDDKINLSQVVEPRYISILPDSMDKFKPSNNCSSLESISSLKKCKPLKEYSIKLFEKPYIGSKNAGEILAIFDPSIGNEGAVRLIYRKDGVDHKFETNFYGDYCSSKHLYLQLVWGSVDGWANLGEGLWGNEGWVNIESMPVIGGNDHFHYFFDNSYYSVSFEYGEEGEILMKDRLGEYDDIELRIEDLLYPSGLMRLKLDCSGGC